MLISSRGEINVPSIGRLPTTHGITVEFGNLEKTPVLGDNGLLGHKEEYTQAAGLKAKLVDTKGLDKEALRNIVGETITLTLTNGQAFTLTEAYLSNTLSLDTSEGEMEVEFFGTELTDIS